MGEPGQSPLPKKDPYHVANVSDGRKKSLLPLFSALSAFPALPAFSALI
jgi:hypothetical protein